MIFDIVIIGAGASGIALASSLAKLQKKILLISDFEKKTTNYKYDKKLYNSEIAAYKGYFGGTKVWGSVCRPFFSDDYKSKIELLPKKKYYIAASKFLNCEYGLKYWYSDNKHLPSPDFKNILSKFKTNVFTMNVPSRTINDELVKNNFIYIKSYKDLSNKKKYVLKNCMVNKIVDVKSKYLLHCKQKSDAFIIKSHKVILAAGTVGSFQILKKSFNDKGLNDYGMIEDNLGKNISDHFHGNIGHIVFKKPMSIPTKKISSSQKLRFSFTPKADHINGRHSIFFHPAFGNLNKPDSDSFKKTLLAARTNVFIFFKSIFYLIKAPSILLEILLLLFINKRLKKFYFWGVFEQQDVSNSLYYDKSSDTTVVKWSIHDTDFSEARNTMIEIKKIFKNLSSSITVYNHRRLQKSLVPSQHLVGSLKQGLNEDKKAVVDKYYKVIGQRSIYCADASIIPIKGFSNITLTVVAQSIKLAELISSKSR